jgi:hypothetical protein
MTLEVTEEDKEVLDIFHRLLPDNQRMFRDWGRIASSSQANTEAILYKQCKLLSAKARETA